MEELSKRGSEERRGYSDLHVQSYTSSVPFSRQEKQQEGKSED